jgi:hypothetical protein
MIYMPSNAFSPAKRFMGRPSAYRTEYCSLIIEAMATGLSAEAAAAKIGISARSLFYWQRSHPDFLQAIQEGRQKALLWWEERAIALAKGEAGNIQIVSLALKNRSRAAHGWNNETVQVEANITAEPPVRPLDVSKLTWEQREALKGILLAARARASED